MSRSGSTFRDKNRRAQPFLVMGRHPFGFGSQDFPKTVK
jgi:hypothetical protein